MNSSKDNIPTPKEIEKEIGEFLSKRFGTKVTFAQPIGRIHPAMTDEGEEASTTSEDIKFELKPEELIAYLDNYIIKQDQAKAVLATKICTHFNRVKYFKTTQTNAFNMTGHIKNNVLMIGPTGVGKTYMIKLIAQKIGVPFVKGDATKFSETVMWGEMLKTLCVTWSVKLMGILNGPNMESFTLMKLIKSPPAEISSERMCQEPEFSEPY